MTLKEQFDAKVALGPGCMLWKSWTRGRRYGGVYFKGKTFSAHRVAYELYVATIPKGLEIDHLCRNGLCVNVTHLEAVPHRVNTQRGQVGKYNAIKTHCSKGHPFDAENTYRWKGHRVCKACSLAATIKAQKKRRGKS